MSRRKRIVKATAEDAVDQGPKNAGMAPTAKISIEKQKEEIESLKEEPDFLRSQLKDALQARKPSPKKKKTWSSDSSSESDSSDERGKKKKQGKGSKGKHSKERDYHFGKRMKCPDDVVNRYKAVLKTFQKTQSINRSCEYHDVDRNTIAFTAVIAEVYIAASEERSRIPAFTSKSTLLQYAQECKTFLDGELQLQNLIKEMKSKRELLPVAYKMKKIVPVP